MKKILEYKVFDLLKNKDNEEFLDKVKKENPDMYGQLLSTIGNKGLEFAKKKYQDYDPEFVKSEKLRKKRESTKEYKNSKSDEMLKLFSDEIVEIKNVISKTPLKTIMHYINDNELISNYIHSVGHKKNYTNEFLKILKKPLLLRRELSHNIKIDTLKYCTNPKYISWFGEEPSSTITIMQYYNLDKKEFLYLIRLNTSGDSYSLPSIDKGKDIEFLRYRNNYIYGLSRSTVNIEEVYNSLNKFSAALSDDFYNKWEMEKDSNKYNL